MSVVTDTDVLIAGHRLYGAADAVRAAELAELRLAVRVLRLELRQIAEQCPTLTSIEFTVEATLDRYGYSESPQFSAHEADADAADRVMDVNAWDAASTRQAFGTQDDDGSLTREQLLGYDPDA